MKRLQFIAIALTVLITSQARAGERCEYANYTPEAFSVFLQNELPLHGIVTFYEPMGGPSVGPSVIPLVRGGGAIVGYAEFREDILNSHSSLEITDVYGIRLMYVEEKNQEITWIKYKDQHPIFRISNYGHGLYHYHKDLPINKTSWRSEFANEVKWLLRVLAETDRVKTLPVPYGPKNHYFYSLLTDPALHLYSDYVAVDYQNGILYLSGRVSYGTYQLLVSKALNLGYTSVNTHKLIVDSAVVAPIPYSPRVATCF